MSKIKQFNKKNKENDVKYRLEIEKILLKKEKSRNFSQNFSVFCKYIPWISISTAIPVSIYFLAGKTTIFNSDFLADVTKNFLDFGDKGTDFFSFIFLVIAITTLSISLVVFIYKNYKKGKIIEKMEKNREEIEKINQKEEDKWFGLCFL